MEEITVLSGKGGTGKTSITASMGTIATKAVYCDNDVDAADLHLIFNPKIKEEHKFTSGWELIIEEDKCIGCGLCIDYCRFKAIYVNKNNKNTIDPFQCEGCRLCERVCPVGAIKAKENQNNTWYVSSTRFGTLVHAKMGPGEENSGKLVTQIRQSAKKIALEAGANFMINDGPPGIGCATIASLSGTNKVLIVSEPTKSGIHDAQRLVELIRSFNLKAFAMINKYNINIDMTRKLEVFFEDKDIPVLAKLPFDKAFVHAMVCGQTIIEYNPSSQISKGIGQAWLEMIK